MGMEIVETNLAVPEIRSEEDMSMDSDTVNIKFGSHVVDEPSKGEPDKVSDQNLPKDAVDEWPEPKQIHSFYFVRYRALEDQTLKAKLEVADKELQKKNQARLQIVEKLKTKRADRSQLITQIRSLSAENKQFRTIMDEKKKEMEPLQQALGKLRGSGGRDRGSGVCSSEEELNNLIKSFQYRIQHESIPLSEEKQILREIKQLEGTREKVIANAAERAKIQAAMGETDAIQGQVKSIGVDLDEVRKEKQVINAKLKQLDEEKLAIEKEIGALEEELTAITQKRDKTFETIKDMRKQREEGNSSFYQNRTLLTKAKSLAARKDVDALREFSEAEVANFMSLWNSNKAIRDDYEKRILPSLDMRQLSRDGRLRNPGEKPLVETSTPSEAEVLKAPTKQKIPEKDVPATTPGDISFEEKAQKPKSAKNPKDQNKKKEPPLEKHDEPVNEPEYFSSNKLQKDSLPKEEEVDEEKLKQLKREEEIAKRKQAEERKKKLAEKAATKAAIKAQKEAEKKLKEREKRARKKAGGADTTADSEEATETPPEVVEEQSTEEKIETPSLPQKNKDRNTTVRHRGRARGTKALPKAILKSRKTRNYWMWGGAAGAVLVALLLLLVGYRYVS